MKKMIASLLSLVMALGLLTACGSGSTPAPQESEKAPAEEPAPASEHSGLKIGLVLTGNASDGGWNQMAADAASTVADKYGCTVNYTESVSSTDYESTIRGYADAGYDIVLAHGA